MFVFIRHRFYIICDLYTYKKIKICFNLYYLIRLINAFCGPKSFHFFKLPVHTFFFSFQDSPVTLAKLEELRKLGFTNDAMNIQALQIANGDLETAVNLILCGLNEDN